MTTEPPAYDKSRLLLDESLISDYVFVLAISQTNTGNKPQGRQKPNQRLRSKRRSVLFGHSCNFKIM
ncbi:hypothetical protein ACTXT7_010784 [Hymenolepis weldensis]